MLQKLGQEWSFVSEDALEAFLWTNLGKILGLVPLKRQFIVNREICDILAVDSAKQLHVLELKNTEDRYVVQQLTRYFDHLITEKPLEDQVDYSQLVRLIAIAPSFHDHNWIDRKHCQLKIDFYQFRLQSTQDAVEFSLWDRETQIAVSPIPLLADQSQLPLDLEDSDTALDPKEVEGKKIKESLDYYIWYRHGHKLGLPPIQPPALVTAKKIPKGSKAFKVIIGYLASGSKKTVTVRVPGRITLHQFSWYIARLVPTALGYYSPSGRYYQHHFPDKHGTFLMIKPHPELGFEHQRVNARTQEDTHQVNSLLADGWKTVFECYWVDGDHGSLVVKMEPGEAYETYLDFFDLKLFQPSTF